MRKHFEICCLYLLKRKYERKRVILLRAYFRLRQFHLFNFIAIAPIYEQLSDLVGAAIYHLIGL